MFLRSRVQLLAVALIATAAAFGQTKLLRFPDIHAERVVFTYGGDLWTAPSTGGTAIRLTSHPGLELFAKFSPDGKWLAFTGQYDGDEQVYVMPSSGGEPKQLTHYPARGPLAQRWGYDNQVYGWTNDGKRVLFRSHRDSYALPYSRLYAVSMDGGPAEAAADAGLEPLHTRRGKQTRLFAPGSGLPFRKAVCGRAGEPLYVFDIETYEAKKITEVFARTAIRCGSGTRSSSTPIATATSTCTPTTRIGRRQLRSRRNKDWDVRWPSTDRRERIVFELNGELQI